MSTAWKRKSYGKVKPVPKPKVKCPDRPKVQELKAIFSRLQKSPERMHNDLLSEALDWWHRNIAWFAFKYKTSMPISVAKEQLAALESLRKGQSSKDNKEKQHHFTEALMHYRRAAVPVLATPLLKPFIAKSKAVTKKASVIDKKLAGRYDKLLTLLSQCFPRNQKRFIAAAKIQDNIPWKIDHELSTIYFSKDICKHLQTMLRSKGLLAVVIELLPLMSRSLALKPQGDGVFTIFGNEEQNYYKLLLQDFEEWARVSKDAPTKIVKRKTLKQKVKFADGPHPLLKGRVRMLVPKFSGISKEDVEAFMSKAKTFKGKKE